jgi:hypothetical protein
LDSPIRALGEEVRDMANGRQRVHGMALNLQCGDDGRQERRVVPDQDCGDLLDRRAERDGGVAGPQRL